MTRTRNRRRTAKPKVPRLFLLRVGSPPLHTLSLVCTERIPRCTGGPHPPDHGFQVSTLQTHWPPLFEVPHGGRRFSFGSLRFRRRRLTQSDRSQGPPHSSWGLQKQTAQQAIPLCPPFEGGREYVGKHVDGSAHLGPFRVTSGPACPGPRTTVHSPVLKYKANPVVWSAGPPMSLVIHSCNPRSWCAC